ncbi:helix-turn-helix transcriptional regulator [Anaerovoracaceae bacterium 42-11]
MLDPIIVGQVIQRVREEKQLSQEVVSGFADIGRTHLSAIERGVRKPTLETFFRIAEALKVSPSALLAEIEEAINKAAKQVQ